MKNKFLILMALLIGLQSCKKEAEPRPLADINLLAGKWVSGTSNTSSELEFDVNKRQMIATKVASNIYGFKAGDIFIKNAEAVDAHTYAGEMLFRSTTGYFIYVNGYFELQGDVIHYVTYSGSSSGSITVSGQRGQYKRMK